jgi:hypothetical protein
MEVLRLTPTGYWLEREEIITIMNRTLRRSGNCEFVGITAINLSMAGCDNENFRLTELAGRYELTLESLRDQIAISGMIILQSSLKDQE